MFMFQNHSPSFNQTASLVASLAAIYSASIVESAVMGCLELFQDTAPPLNVNKNPDVDILGIMWPTSQSHFHLLFIFIEIKNFHCHSCVMFTMKFMNICNDQVNYDEIIIQ